MDPFLKKLSKYFKPSGDLYVPPVVTLRNYISVWYYSKSTYRLFP